MDLKVKINAVDVTDKVRIGSLSRSQKLSRQIDTCSLIIDDPTASLTITSLMEIIVSNDAETERFFGGYVARPEIGVEGVSKVFTLSCQDWSVRLDRLIVDDIYAGVTDAAVILDAFTAKWPAVDAATHVDTGITVDRLVVDQASLRDLMDELCKLSGFDWYLDYDLALWYFDPASPPVAAFALSSNPNMATTFPLEVQAYAFDGSQIINKLLIKGFEMTSEVEHAWYDGGTVQTIFNLGRQWIGITDDVIFAVDSYVGGVYTVYSVGTKGVDTMPAYDCLWDASTMSLEFYIPPLANAPSFRVIGRYTVQVSEWYEDAASIAQYSLTLEGLIEDTKITTTTMAAQIAASFFVENAYALEQLTVMCWKSGLAVGELINVYETVRGINGYYLIQSIDRRWLGAETDDTEVEEYYLELGAWTPDLNDILMGLQDKIGGLSSGRISGVAVGGSSQLLLTPTSLTSEGDFTGIFEEGIAGASIAVGNLIWRDTDQEWYLCDADFEGKTNPQLAIALDAGEDGDTISVLLYGYYQTGGMGTSGGEILWVSNTPGAIATSEPSTGDFARIIGRAYDANILFFNPDPTYIELA